MVTDDTIVRRNIAQEYFEGEIAYRWVIAQPWWRFVLYESPSPKGFQSE